MRGRRHRRLARAAAVAAGLALALAACGADDAGPAGLDAEEAGDFAFEEDRAQEESAVGGDDAEGDADGGGSAAAGDAEVEADDADDVVTFGQGIAAGRQLARTATITLEVADVEDAASAVAAAATRAGGFVSDANISGGDFGGGELTLRVPATALDDTLERLGAIGLRVVESGISTEDLTDQLVDLQARIDNLERLELELQGLLAEVENADPEARELLTVFDRINQTRSEIERLQAQRAAAADRVALATIRVQLIAEAVAPAEVEPEPRSTIEQALAATRDAFGAIADALIWLVVTILPVLLVVVGIPVALIVLAVRTNARRRRSGPPPAASDASPAPRDDGPPQSATAERRPEPAMSGTQAPPPSTSSDERDG